MSLRTLSPSVSLSPVILFFSLCNHPSIHLLPSIQLVTSLLSPPPSPPLLFLITPSHPPAPLPLSVARETAVHSVAVNLVTLSFYYLWVRCLIKEDKGWETKERLTLNICKMLVFINTSQFCRDRTACEKKKGLL